MAVAKLKPAPAPEPAPAAPPKKKPMLIIIVAVVALVLIGGGGAWWFLKPKPGADGADEQHAGIVAKKPPIFVPLEPFVVNLIPENGDHYLQIGLVYQVTDDKSVDTLKGFMPVIRNKVLMLLSSKKPSDISTPDGKQKLVEELVTAARQSIPGTTPQRGIESAMLSAMVIQ